MSIVHFYSTSSSSSLSYCSIRLSCSYRSALFWYILQQLRSISLESSKVNVRSSSSSNKSSSVVVGLNISKSQLVVELELLDWRRDFKLSKFCTDHSGELIFLFCNIGHTPQLLASHRFAVIRSSSWHIFSHRRHQDLHQLGMLDDPLLVDKVHPRTKASSRRSLLVIVPFLILIVFVIWAYYETSQRSLLESVSSDTSNGCITSSGGTCHVIGCSASRGPTECIDGLCQCQSGYCAQEGVCIGDQFRKVH